MRYWWVNQNQTYKEETTGGYLWSPKRNQNGARNQFYENMREVAPGDLVFSFRGTKIVAISVAASNCYEAPKPDEFGVLGQNWDDTGWKVDAVYSEMTSPVRPKDHIDEIRPLLPDKYSPLQQTGDGLQSVYLAEISQEFASLLQSMLGSAGSDLNLLDVQPDDRRREAMLGEVERQIESQITGDAEIKSTEKQQLVMARRGQGRFRENVAKFENSCRITGVDDSRFLIASHIKPWRSSSNPERLDGENGLLLSPNVDHLFDRGLISFQDNGILLVSPAVKLKTVCRLGIPVDSKYDSGPFTENQKQYLTYHRREVFLEAGRQA
jgi:putative restriction endonuclease